MRHVYNNMFQPAMSKMAVENIIGFQTQTLFLVNIVWIDIHNIIISGTPFVPSFNTQIYCIITQVGITTTKIIKKTVKV